MSRELSSLLKDMLDWKTVGRWCSWNGPYMTSGGTGRREITCHGPFSWIYWQQRTMNWNKRWKNKAWLQRWKSELRGIEYFLSKWRLMLWWGTYGKYSFPDVLVRKNTVMHLILIFTLMILSWNVSNQIISFWIFKCLFFHFFFYNIYFTLKYRIAPIYLFIGHSQFCCPW